MADELFPDSEPVGQRVQLRHVPVEIIGVLAEKAKTTPDAYPMTLNAVTSGCNANATLNFFTMSASQEKSRFTCIAAVHCIISRPSGPSRPRTFPEA